MALQPEGHSPLGFSKAERWLGCPGSVAAEAALPNTSSPAAERGSRLHLVAAQALTARSLEPLADLDDEDRALVEPYVVHVGDLALRTKGLLLVEEPFHLDHLHELLWGTSDAVLIYDMAGETWVEVVDLKTGYGFVPTKENGRLNVQLVGYLLGGIQAATRQGKRVKRAAITVVQPSRGGVRREVVALKDLPELVADLLQGVDAALDPKAKRTPGDHCEFCAAAGNCPALRQAAMAAVQAGFGPEPEEITRDTDEGALVAAMEAMPLVKMWLKAVQAEVFKRLNDGARVGSYKLVAKRGRRAWLNEAQARQRVLGAGLDEDDIEVRKLKSPAQIEKLAKKAKVTIDLAALAPSKSSGATVVPGSDPREALTPGAAMFEDEPEED